MHTRPIWWRNEVTSSHSGGNAWHTLVRHGTVSRKKLTLSLFSSTVRNYKNIFGLFSSQYVSKVKLYDYQKKQMKTTCWTIISLITDTNTDPDTKVTTLVKLDLDRDKWPLTSNNLINSFHFDLAMYLTYKVLNQWEKLFIIFLRRIDKSHTNIPNILYYNLNVLPSMTIMVYMAH